MADKPIGSNNVFSNYTSRPNSKKIFKVSNATWRINWYRCKNSAIWTRLRNGKPLPKWSVCRTPYSRWAPCRKNQMKILRNSAITSPIYWNRSICWRENWSRRRRRGASWIHCAKSRSISCCSIGKSQWCEILRRRRPSMKRWPKGLPRWKPRMIICRGNYRRTWEISSQRTMKLISCRNSWKLWGLTMSR